MGEIKVIIDGIEVRGQKGMTILEAAKQLAIAIPTLCYRKALSVSGGCRICVVEVEGSDKLVASCHTPIKEGMVIYTRSSKSMEAHLPVLKSIFELYRERTSVFPRIIWG